MEENLNNTQQPKMQEPKKQEPVKKSKSKKVKVIVITLSVILVLILGLQVYAATNGHGNIFFMIKDLTTFKNASGENEVFIEDKTEEDIENNVAKKELDINSDEVKKLYNYILKESSQVESLAYQSKKVTVNDLENDTKLCTLLVNLKDSEADETKKVQGVVKELTQYTYNANTIKNKTKEIFGENINIQYKTVDDLVSGNDYTYENGKYIKSEIQQGGGNYPAQTLEYVLKAEQDGDIINIYDKFVYIYVDLGIGYKTCIYKDSSRKSIILDNVSDKQLYDEFLMQTYSRDEQFNKNAIKKIEAASGKEAPTYKHTFKKNSDGNYYWYSTEPMEEIKETTNTTNNNTNKNEQLEPDNYAEEVMKDEQQNITNYITSVNWKRYESADDGFSFVYPDDYTVVKSPDRGIVVEISGEVIGKDIDTGKEVKSNLKIRMYSTRNVESYEIRDILEKGTGYIKKNGDKWYTNYIEGYNTPGSAGYQKIENYVNYEDIGNGLYRQRMIEFEADNRDNIKITNIINHIIDSIEMINM